MKNTLLKEKTARPVTPLGILVEHLQVSMGLLQTVDVCDDLTESVKKAYNLAANLESYLSQCTTPESEALANLAKKTCQQDWSKLFTDKETVRHLEQEMLSGHLEAQTLKMFVHMTKAKRILEVGMFTGYSALAMAEALPPDGSLIACEVDEFVANFAQNCFKASPHGEKITVKVGPALETMVSLVNANHSFDLVFIDADKKEYMDYVNLLLETELLAANGFICVDNTLLQGQVYLPPDERTANGEAIALFNQKLSSDPRVEQVLLPLRDGLTIIRRK